MTTVNDILNYLNTIAPPYMKEDWDNVGLLCGSYNQPVTKVLMALDPFEHVCREAEEIGADLLITHHPLIFVAPHSITDASSVGRSILQLSRAGISAINAHTNLDCAPGGVNDVLAQRLGLNNIHVLNPRGTDANGAPWGLLRAGNVTEQPLDAFITVVKNALECEGIRFVNGGRPVCKVAVGGGSCGSELRSAYDAGCDTFVTADIKYNQFWDATELGINLIDAGHFHTENPVVAVLAEKLQNTFPEIEVIQSKTHADCVKFF